MRNGFFLSGLVAALVLLTGFYFVVNGEVDRAAEHRAEAASGAPSPHAIARATGSTSHHDKVLVAGSGN
ncbi:MAG: hypothetical protein ABI364_03580 [Caldimonas sp.]